MTPLVIFTSLLLSQERVIDSGRKSFAKQPTVMGFWSGYSPHDGMSGNRDGALSEAKGRERKRTGCWGMRREETLIPDPHQGAHQTLAETQEKGELLLSRGGKQCKPYSLIIWDESLTEHM